MGICDWISCISARVFVRYIASENVNRRLMSTPGCPIQVSRYSPTSDQFANRLYRIRCALRFSRGHCSAYGFLAGGHFTDGERMPSPAAQVGFIPGRVSNGKYWWNGMTGTVPGDVFLEDTFFLWCFFGFNCEFFLSLLPLRSDEFERIPWFRGWTRRRQWWTTFLAASQANKWETSSQASLSNFKMTLCLIHHYIAHSQSFKSSLYFPGSTWHLILSPQGATDNTKQALMETVNSSSSVLLQKLDLTQQDLLKQSKARNPVVTATKKRPLVNLKPEKIGGNSPRFKDSLVFDWQLSCDEIRNMIVHHRTIGSSSAIRKPLIRFLSSWTNPNILHRNRMPCWKALPPNKMVFQSRWTPDMSSRANAWWRWKARQHSWWKLWFFQFQAALSTHTHTSIAA